jgi:outer membrane protein assembly factor BamE (lipoprotein component of BamABCDE complex)
VLRRRLRPLARAIACVAATIFVAGFSGCAAVKAARQPEKKNLGVLHEGTPRAQVIAELGAPTYTKPKPDGSVEDVFAFKQGYTKGVKMGRAFMHGAADVATGGLWEVVGIPAEIWADGTEVQVLVTYDQDERVKYRRIFKGQEAFGKKQAALAKREKKSDAATVSVDMPDESSESSRRNSETRLAGDGGPAAPSSSVGGIEPASAAE